MWKSGKSSAKNWLRMCHSQMLHQLLFVLLLIQMTKALEEGDPCDIGSSTGRCMPGSECKTIAEAIKMGMLRSQRDIGSCGFNVYEEIICCPILGRVTTGKPSTNEPRFQNLRPAAKACESFSKLYAPNLTPHILNGIPAEEGEFPHMAALGYASTGVGGYDFQCGGSLIDSRYVLTAAHCVNNPNNPPIIVRLGTINLKNSSKAIDIEIANVSVHPNYSSLRIYDDIAVLELKKAVTFGGSILPVCLLEDLRTLPTPVDVFISGWGRTETESVKRSDVLLKAVVSLENQEACKEIFKPSFKQSQRIRDGLQDGHICAIDRKLQRGSCEGDSGGPLSALVDPDRRIYRQIGVVSTGFICGSDTPDIFTRVSHYLDYIEGIVWKTLIQK